MQTGTSIPATNPLQAGKVTIPFTGRIQSIDLLRGLVMVIMALDHTRDFFHSQAQLFDPLDPAKTNPWLYATRYITHFCAPVFTFLAGTSAWLQGARKSKAELSRFLITRGLWLIALELVVMTLIMTFDPTYSIFLLLTIWSIGISMVILGLLIHLPFALIVGIGLAIVFGHNLLDAGEPANPIGQPWWYLLLHQSGPILLPDAGRAIMVGYPFLPWTGLMLLGYAFGRLYTTLPADKRRAVLAGIGLGLLALFGILRYFTHYGDPQPWEAQRSGLYTLFDFLDVRKYPPSLLYMCITIGPALLFLAWCGEARSRLAQIISVYGKVPMFYYIVHFLVLHTAAAIYFLARGHSVQEGMAVQFGPKFVAQGEGLSLGGTYLVWIATVIALYPLCRWYARYKATHRKWWLSYL